MCVARKSNKGLKAASVRGGWNEAAALETVVDGFDVVSETFPSLFAGSW